MDQGQSQSILPRLVSREDFPSHMFRAMLDYHLSSLHAQDRTTNSVATLNTSYDLGVSGAWVTAWSKHLSSFLEFGLRAVNFESSTNPNKILSQTAHILARFSLGGISGFGPRLTLYYFVSEGQKLFLHGLPTNSIAVDAIVLPYLSAMIQYKVISAGATDIGVQALASWLGPGSTDGYSVKMGSAFAGSIYITHTFGKDNADALSLELGFSQRNQNTSEVTLNQTNIDEGLTVKLPLFGIKESAE